MIITDNNLKYYDNDNDKNDNDKDNDKDKRYYDISTTIRD